jgi:putative restriction endonuclease
MQSAAPSLALRAGAGSTDAISGSGEPVAAASGAFGPPRQRSHPEYPFWRLQNDGLWEVPDSAKLVRRRSNTDPKKSELIAHRVVGGFPEAVFDAFRQDQQVRDDVVRMLLQSHFPESLHEDILNEVGLTLAPLKIKRDPAFREEVLQAYERRCAECGDDTQVGPWDLALDAAHIQWHQAAGPSVVQNGLALRAIHHKALDRGAIGLAEDGTILVSGTLHGSTGIQEWFLAFKGRRLREPHSPSLLPAAAYFACHRREVFRGRARE